MEREEAIITNTTSTAIPGSNLRALVTDWIPSSSAFEHNGLLLFSEVDEEGHEKSNAGLTPTGPLRSVAMQEEENAANGNNNNNGTLPDVQKKQKKLVFGRGRVFFSFDEIPLNVLFKTELANELKRISVNEFVIDGITVTGTDLEIISMKKEAVRKAELSDTKNVIFVKSYHELPADVTKYIEKAGIKVSNPNRDELKVLLSLYNFLVKKDGPVYKVKPTVEENAKAKSHTYDEYKVHNHNPLLFKVAEMTITDLMHPEKLFRKAQLSGQGGYGKVFFAQQIDTKKNVAIKKISHTSDKEKFQNIREIGFLTLAAHPNVVHYIQGYRTPREIWIVTEFMEGGTLDSALKSRVFAESEVAYVAKEILKALEFLHYKNFVHRDVTCNNVMLTYQGRVKLIDFGLCADLFAGPKKRMAGTPGWLCPEMIRGEPYGTEVDIWCLAVSLLLSTGIPPPFASFMKLYEIATQGIPQEFYEKRLPKGTSHEFIDFLQQCLQTNPKHRKTARELLDHPFLNKADTQPQFQKVVETLFLHNALKSFGLM